MMDCTYNRTIEAWQGADAAEVRRQVARLSGLRNYPREKTGQGELIRFLALAENTEHMRRVIDEILESSPECPPPAKLRGIVFDLRPKSKRVRCATCAGEGYRSVPMLVTYRGNSYNIDQQQPMPEMGFDEAEEFAARVPAHQAVLSCAVACHCRGGM